MKWSGRGLRGAFRTASALLRAPWLAPTQFAQLTASAGQVIAVDEFGSNPGQLRMLVYAPKAPPLPGAPLVVVLHGCGQSAATFAQESGWIAAADRFGLPLILPEQTSRNNRGRCFHWFRPADISRGRGEALSIRQMVSEAVARFAADPKSVFVVGLSAGGAMAAALLAAYPDVFRAGAVVGGLPVGCASNAAQGLTLMADAGHLQAAGMLAAKARALGPTRYKRRWPRLAVWAGEADHTVDPKNAAVLARQWVELQGLSEEPRAREQVTATADCRVWGHAAEPAVELWTVARLGHGYPVTDAAQTSRWVLLSDVSATDHIVRFFGLIPAALWAKPKPAVGVPRAVSAAGLAD
jgi:poly(hydroxyalkanoate) depolymerase family esterase